TAFAVGGIGSPGLTSRRNERPSSRPPVMRTMASSTTRAERGSRPVVSVSMTAASRAIRGVVPSIMSHSAPLWPRGRAKSRGRHVVVGEHAQGGAVHVVVLAGAQRPEKRHQPGEAECKRHRYEIDQHVHGTLAVMVARPPVTGVTSGTACLRARTRSALSVTRIDELDMAAAAIRGVA